MLIGVVAVVVVAFLAVIGWVGWRMATPAVQSKLLSYSVVSDSAVDVTFEIRRDELGHRVRAARPDAKHVDVGYAEVTITRGRAYVQPTYRIATLAPATTVEPLGCEPDEAPLVHPPQFAPGTTNPPQVATIDGS